MAEPKVSGEDSGVLVVQPHGGALRRGNPGNKGGRRYTDAVLDALEEDLVSAQAILRAKLLKGDLTNIELLKYAEFTARSVLPDQAAGISSEIVRSLAAEVSAVLMPLENGEALLREILARWIPVIARRGA